VPQRLDWFQWFLAFFDGVKDRFTIVLDAAGCSEWCGLHGSDA